MSWMSWVRLLLLALSVCAAGACRSGMDRIEPLASAELAADFATYRVRRVGLLPFQGEALDREYADVVQQAFPAELVRTTPYELVRLEPRDLEEVPQSQTHRRGGYDPRTIVDVSRRFRLDGVLIGTVTDFQYFTPLRLGVVLELLSSDTGATLWSSTVHLDATDPKARRGLEAFHKARADSLGAERWQLTLLSPRLFARFAAWHVASLL
jgi:hypothetical protein